MEVGNREDEETNEASRLYYCSNIIVLFYMTTYKLTSYIDIS